MSDPPDALPLPRRIRSVLLAVLGTVLALAAAELIVRWWLVSPSTAVPDARYGWVFPPHTRLVQAEEGWSVARTNSAGLLDDELRVPRARVRALLIGDSFVEALQVSHQEHFGTVAERLMPGLEVVCVGYSGRSPADYADWIEEFGPALAPDVVVVQVSDLDLSDLLKPAVMARLAGGAGRLVAPLPPERGLARLERRILRSSALVTVIWRRVKLIAALRKAHAAPPFRPAVASVPRAPFDDPRLPGVMDALHRRLAARSRRLLYFYLPPVDYYGSRPGYLEPRAAAFFHAFAVRNRVTLVDPIADFWAEFERTGQPLHGFQNSVLGVGHINVAGHRVAGECLARAIAEAMR